MTTEPPDDDDDRPDDDVGADPGLLRKLEKLPPDLRALAEEIEIVNLAKSMVSTVSRFRFERFEVIDYKIGGMGLVLQAYDPELRRNVAIKLWAHDGPQTEAQLRAEATTLAQLSHPNIVAVYDIDTWEGGRLYFVMEWVDGVDGHEWMSERRSWQEIRDVFVQAGRGLAAAHKAGIVHRDFKPSNMLVGADGRVRVSDFGIAETLGGHSPNDRGRALGGTVEFMPPERLLGLPGDARADQFSFCVSMWLAMFGTRPFEGQTRAELLEAIQSGEIEVDLEDPGRPRWMTHTVLYGLEFKPSNRYPNMDELLQALEDEREPDGGEAEDEGEDDGEVVIGGSSPPPLLHDPAQSQSPRWAWAPFWTGLGIGLFGLVAFAAGVWLAQNGRVQDDAPDSAGQEVEEVIITPEDVIAHIKAGTYDETIEDRWSKQCDRWRRHRRPIYQENLDIAEALLQRAKLLKERDEVKAAKNSKQSAKRWCDVAQAELANAKKSTEPADDLDARIREFEEGSVPAD